ncbi:NepR family anti-sigma factor [Microvirga sp. GCM10011540]|uniref:NepR family anti-sigma factor n=2 Tax=Microvirga TaxID=186650 RepID=UPI00361D44A4
MSNHAASMSFSATEPHQPKLGPDIRVHLGRHLKALYDEAGTEHLPDRLKELVKQLEKALADQGETVEPAFRDGILNALPNLRAFALSLTGNPHRADDLVQDTVLRAWSKRGSFQPGTNLNAWLFTILRNSFFSEHRKRSREVEDSDGAYAAQLKTVPDQMDNLHVQDLRSALERLVPEQREALLLVGAEGLSYEETAAICGTAVGTIKSRVNRARTRLAELLGYSPGDLASDNVIRSAMSGGE